MSRFPFINVLFSAALAASASAVSAQEEPLIGPPEPQFSEAADSGNDTEKGENVAPDENIAGSIQLEGDTEEAAPSEALPESENGLVPESAKDTENVKAAENKKKMEVSGNSADTESAESVKNTEEMILPADVSAPSLLSEGENEEENSEIKTPAEVNPAAGVLSQPKVFSESETKPEPEVKSEKSTVAEESAADETSEKIAGKDVPGVSPLPAEEPEAAAPSSSSPLSLSDVSDVSDASDASKISDTSKTSNDSNDSDLSKLSENAAPSENRSKVPAETVSISRRLLDSLCETDAPLLEGVEDVDLRTFLSAPRMNSDSESLKAGLRLYWQMASIRSEIRYWQSRTAAFQKLAEGVYSSGINIYSNAAAAAQANLDAARVALRSCAVKLGASAGYVREITAKTLPHAGVFDTRYDEIDSSRVTPAMTYYHGLIFLHGEQLTAAASAYRAAENLLDAAGKQGKMSSSGDSASAEVLISSWDALNERRKVFFDVLMQYNEDILNYTLTVSQRRGPSLAQLLTVPLPEVSLENYFPPQTPPSIPTPPPVSAPSASPDFTASGMNSDPNSGLNSGLNAQAIQTPTQELPSVMNHSEDGNAAPPRTFETPGASGTDGAAASSGTEEYGENAYIEINPPVTVPGNDAGVPDVETPPAGSEFQPIGGETGVDTNPILNVSPSGKDGASLNFENRMKNSVFRTVSYAASPEPHSVLVPESNNKNVQISNGEGFGASDEDISVSSFYEKISLADVLTHAVPRYREAAVHAYWRYVMYSKQIYVLEYQQEILRTLSRRVLEDSLENPVSEYGLLLEMHFLTLKTELFGAKARAWKELCALWPRISVLPVWQTGKNFPIAETSPKVEGFQIGLDRYAPGSHQEQKTLPQARQLYFCVNQLPSMYKSVSQLSDLIAPAKTHAVLSELETRPYNEFPAFLRTLALARETSFQYFRLVNSINEAYSSCILADNSTSVPVKDLVQILTDLDFNDSSENVL